MKNDKHQWAACQVASRLAKLRFRGAIGGRFKVEFGTKSAIELAKVRKYAGPLLSWLSWLNSATLWALFCFSTSPHPA